MHAKDQCSIINTSVDMSQVKVFVTDGQTDRWTDRQRDRGTDRRMRFNVPTLSRKAEDNKSFLVMDVANHGQEDGIPLSLPKSSD